MLYIYIYICIYEFIYYIIFYNIFAGPLAQGVLDQSNQSFNSIPIVSKGFNPSPYPSLGRSWGPKPLRRG